jgi:hypothetical protein
MKTCFKCGERQPLSEFYKHAQMADGHLNKCKTCTKSDVWHHRRDHADSVRAYDRRRAKDPLRIADGSRRTAEWRKKYPERWAAHIAVNNAVRDGRLVKQPCQKCGDKKVEGHHPDYGRPLHVVWLCPVHHREIHLAYPVGHYMRTGFSMLDDAA